jgi:hypothetical protein
LGELREAPRPSERFIGSIAGVATRCGARQTNEHGVVFICATDLNIVSAALALFIVDSGKRVWDEPERAEIVRAREMMDCVDDELYALSHVK